jgi:hypothetical protein
VDHPVEEPCLLVYSDARESWGFSPCRPAAFARPFLNPGHLYKPKVRRGRPRHQFQILNRLRLIREKWSYSRTKTQATAGRAKARTPFASTVDMSAVRRKAWHNSHEGPVPLGKAPVSWRNRWLRVLTTFPEREHGYGPKQTLAQETAFQH